MNKLVNVQETIYTHIYVYLYAVQVYVFGIQYKYRTIMRHMRKG